jgi:biotin operon repressor
MSLDALKWAWEQDCPNPTAKLVLMALADHANSDGECWPSMKRVAELTGISSRQVSTHITKLEGLGYVTKGARRRWEGQLRGWEYRVNLRQNPTSGSVLPVASGSPASAPAEADFRSEPTENRKKEPLADKPPESSTKKKDNLFETVTEVCGIDPTEMTRSSRGQVNKALKELREVGATEQQVRHKAKAYRTQYPNATLTPTALVKHWSSFGEIEKKQARASIWETYDPPESYYL